MTQGQAIMLAALTVLSLVNLVALVYIAFVLKVGAEVRRIQAKGLLGAADTLSDHEQRLYALENRQRLSPMPTQMWSAKYYPWEPEGQKQ